MLITSNQNVVVNKHYLGVEKTLGGIVNYFVNPTPLDFIKASEMCYLESGRRRVQFLISNSRKKVYIADGYFSKFYDICHVIGIFSYDVDISFDWLHGIAESDPEICQGNWFLHYSPSIENKLNSVEELYDKDFLFGRDYLKEFFSLDWSWVDKYIYSSEYIEELRKSFWHIMDYHDNIKSNYKII